MHAKLTVLFTVMILCPSLDARDEDPFWSASTVSVKRITDPHLVEAVNALTLKAGAESGHSVKKPVPFLDISLLYNGDFKQGGHYWDKPGLQIPSQGMQAPYDPMTDPGFNHFDISNNVLTLAPGEVVQQRILVSPGYNKVSGLYSVKQAGQWSLPAPFVDVIRNPHGIHVMHTFRLEAVGGLPTRYTGIEAFCPRAEVTPGKFLKHLDAEIEFILDLHLDTCTTVAPNSTAIFKHAGLHQDKKYTDFRDRGSLEKLYLTKHAPSPHAYLYLDAAKNGFSEYEQTARDFAMGVLGTLNLHNGYAVPYRFRFSDNEWLAPGPGDPLVMHTLLSYLCDCGEYFKDPDFFVAAYVVAEQMIYRNWWNLYPDPEGLYFVSSTFTLDENNELVGKFIGRSPLPLHGASISNDSDDHRLLLGAAALSKFVRVFQENAEYTGGLDTNMIQDALKAIRYSIFSFYVYSNKFNENWVDNFTNQAKLTAAWWSNYDRRDDYAGYGFGLGMIPIFRDQVSLFGYGALKDEYWVKPMFYNLHDYAVMWGENARRGGIEAADTNRFYHGFRILSEIEEVTDWTDKYFLEYIDGLNQMVKGFMHDGYPPELGTWEIWDFEPYHSAFAKEVTVPGVLLSWAGDVHALTKGKLVQENLLPTLLDALLEIAQDERGEAGYERELNDPTIIESGGEFRWAIGLFDLRASFTPGSTRK
jgi:hypothetical protein